MLYRIGLSVRGQELTSKSVKMASNTVKEVECHFSFEGEEWEVDVKRAVFSNERGNRYSVVLNDNKCFVPHEVLTGKGCISVNVVGAVMNGDDLIERITTYKNVIIDNVQKVYTDGLNSTDPTPTDFERIVALFGGRITDIEEQEDGWNAKLDDAPSDGYQYVRQDGEWKKGTTDYNDLENKPQINNVELTGNKSLDDLGINIPVMLSELEDDSTHRLVTDAEKSTWNNKQNVLTAGANITITNDVISATVGLHLEVVQTLPEVGQANVIYLVPNGGTTPNIYDEYVWIVSRSAYEKIGTTEIDLSNYYTKSETYNKEEVDEAIEESKEIYYITADWWHTNDDEGLWSEISNIILDVDELKSHIETTYIRLSCYYNDSEEPVVEEFPCDVNFEGTADADIVVQFIKHYRENGEAFEACVIKYDDEEEEWFGADPARLLDLSTAKRELQSEIHFILTRDSDGTITAARPWNDYLYEYFEKAFPNTAVQLSEPNDSWYASASLMYSEYRGEYTRRMKNYMVSFFDDPSKCGSNKRLVILYSLYDTMGNNWGVITRDIDQDISSIKENINNLQEDVDDLETGKQDKATTATFTLAIADWTNKQQTVNVTGVTATNNVFVNPVTVSKDDWASCGIWCTAQADGSLTFSADTVPTVAINGQVVIL